MAPSSGELWGHHLMPSTIEVDCLLPTGIIVVVKCNRDETLEQIKQDLWREAKKWPLFNVLSAPSSYIFHSILQDADWQEFYDETRRLCDLRLFRPMLKLMEPKGNRDETMLNTEIGNAVGIHVNEFNDLKELEVMTFRRDILHSCADVIQERERGGLPSLLLYNFPPDIDSEPTLPHNLQEIVAANDNKIFIAVWVISQSRERVKYTVKVEINDLPEKVIEAVIRKRMTMRGKKLTPDQYEQCIMQYTPTYVLKVCGCKLFLMANHPISQYKYIRHCLAREKRPQLMLMSKDNVCQSIVNTEFAMPSYVMRGKSALQDINKKQTMTLWQIERSFRVKINSASYVNVRDGGKIYVKTGIFHATEPLCLLDAKPVESSHPKWEQWLDYKLHIPDIPRSAKLCLSICCVSKKQKRKVDYALAWGNLNLFDFNNHLLTDKVSLRLWPTPHGFDELIYPIGLPGSNPNKDSSCLEIEFERYKYPVIFPSKEEFRLYEETLRNSSFNPIHTQGTTNKLLHKSESQNESEKTSLVQLQEIASKDPLSEISEQEKELMWKCRKLCLKVPDILPKLLLAVKWNCREDVIQLYALLRDWPLIPPMIALQLLYCSYTDPVVREFAVHCLEKKLTDDKLSQFLLQLVQVLKFEPYLDNPLTRFLLRRSLLNQKIGHFFFWHLKSEMHLVSIRVRFGLILEAYCRACGSYLKSLSRQVEALDKLTTLTDSLKMEKDDEQFKFMSNQVSQADYLEALQNFPSPLASEQILGNLRVQECKVMSSKKRPLMLTWENVDLTAEFLHTDFKIIFKNGDDLRQDMLTLQVIRVMDNIWQSEGLDLRMLPYGCLSTGNNVGMIEVVRNAYTVMNIQRQDIRAAMQVRTRELHRWIKEHNDKRYNAAIDAFTRSCAGYCVATFVLGIGDRNPDNIMVNEEGQIFHIDFGHFLDHRKKKFGINRERVPFVLTEDFLSVIARGADNPKESKEFKEFMELCGKAYIQLHQHAHVFITLFTMMLSCGIPELQSLDDIGYLRKTLAVDLEPMDALLYFNSQFSQAYGGGWTTKLDWLFHYIKHRN